MDVAGDPEALIDSIRRAVFSDRFAFMTYDIPHTTAAFSAHLEFPIHCALVFSVLQFLN